MRRAVLLAAALLVARVACGASATIHIQETVTMEVAGATAAYALDPGTVDVLVSSPGHITLIGRAAGSTQIVVVTAAGTSSFLITVAPAASRVPAAAPASNHIATADIRYAGGARQWQDVVDVLSTSGQSKSQLHIFNVRYQDRIPGRSSMAFPSVFYRIMSPRRELTLLDDLVDLSPVTIQATQIRGVHLLQGPIEIHAGYAASTMYDDLFLPTDRRWVGSAGYAFRRGDFRLIPSAFVFLSQPKGSGARRGVAGSLASEYRSGDALFVRSEMAVSRSVAASLEVRRQTEWSHLHASIDWKPEDFPTLGLTTLPGLHGNADWSGWATKRLSIDSYATFDRTPVAGFNQSVAIANVSLRYALSSQLSILSGADGSFVRSATTPGIRTIGIPAALAYDAPRFGAAALYRIVNNSQTSSHGDSLRFSSRASVGRFHAGAWIERQRQVPTLDLIFRDAPGLELELIRLGISVRTPDDLSRVLRDNAALINLGYIEGVTVNLTPRRTEAGADFGVSSRDGRDQLRLHAVRVETDGVSSKQNATLATLAYSRRVASSTEVYGSWSWWHTSTVLSALNHASLEIGVRHRFDGVPELFQRGGAIDGIVFLDPQMRGKQGEGTTPLPGVVVTLDGRTSVKTDASGSFVFRGVSAGRHRVTATLASVQAAFFTTPSTAELDAPGRAEFGVVWSPARITGRVTSDAHAGVAGITIVATNAAGTQTTTNTDSEGAFNLATLPGEVTLAISRESLPSGFEVEDDGVRHVTADAVAAHRVTFVVRAQRSVAGKADGSTKVRIEPLGRTVTSDASGNFVFRSLPAGTFTVTANGYSRTVNLPAEPVIVNDCSVQNPNSPR